MGSYWIGLNCSSLYMFTSLLPITNNYNNSRFGQGVINSMTYLGYQVSLVVRGLSFRSDDRGLNPAPTTGGHLRSQVALCDVGTHQPVVTMDCLHLVTGR